MTSALHKDLVVGEIHVPYQWEYADDIAREAATGFASSDVGKFARQLDNDSIWMLTDESPVTWIAVSQGGSGVIPHEQTHRIDGTDALSSGLSTGLLYGGILSVNALDDTKFDITDGAGIIVDNYTNPASPSLVLVEWEAQIGVTDPHIADGTETYISIDENGDFVFAETEQDCISRRTYISVGWTSHPDLTTLEDARTQPVLAVDALNQFVDFLTVFGAFNIDGNVYGPNSTNLTIKRSAGRTFEAGVNYPTTPLSPHVISTTDEAPVADIWYFYRDPVEPTGWNNNVPSVSVIDPEHWDDGTGTLATVTTGKFTLQLITFYAPWDVTDIQYGQVVYDTLADAEEHVLAAVDLNPWNSDWDTLRGWLIVKQGATDLTVAADAKFLVASRFGVIQGAAGGTGGVAAHKDTHKSGGTDAFTSTDLLEAVVKRLRESSGPTDLTLGAVADGALLQRSGSAIVGVTPVFGNNFQSVSSDSESTTTSVSYQQKLRLTTPSLPAGNYRLNWYCEYRQSSISDDIFIRVEQDDTTSLAEMNAEVKDNVNYFPNSGFAVVALTAGIHTFDMDYRSETAGTTSYIRRSRIAIERVS
jgi:hypothetical protein